jgi:hypothetical protein
MNMTDVNDILEKEFKTEMKFFKKHNIDIDLRLINGYYLVIVKYKNKKMYSFQATAFDLEITIGLLYKTLKTILDDIKAR